MLNVLIVNLIGSKFPEPLNSLPPQCLVYHIILRECIKFGVFTWLGAIGLLVYQIIAPKEICKGIYIGGGITCSRGNISE